MPPEHATGVGQVDPYKDAPVAVDTKLPAASLWAPVSTFAASALILALNFGNSVLLSRLLGPEGRGALTAAMLWPTVFSLVGSMGIIPATLYFASRRDSDPNRVLGTSQVLAIAQGLIVVWMGTLLLPVCLKNQSPEVLAASKLYMWMVPISLSTQCAAALLQSKQHMAAFNVVRVSVTLGIVSGTAALVVAHSVSLHGLVMVNLVANFLCFLVAAWAVLGLRLGLVPRMDKSLVRPMLRYGVAVQAGDVSQLLNLRLDQLVMSVWLPAAQLGLYVAAVNATSPVNLVSTAVRMVAAPRITSKEPQGQLEEVARSFRVYAITVAVPFLFLFWVMPWLLPWVFGDGFRGAVATAEVLLAAALLLGAKEVLSGGAQALGRPWLSSRSELCSFVVTAGMLLSFLPRWGILGAGLASLAAYGVALVVLIRGLGRAGLSTLSLGRFRREDFAPLSRLVMRRDFSSG